MLSCIKRKTTTYVRMARLHVSTLILAFLAMFHCSQSHQTSPTFLLQTTTTTSEYNSVYEKLNNVFDKGKFQVTNPIIVTKSQYSSPEKLLIVSPKEAGSYPVLFFIHGTMLLVEDYSDLFNRIASHGYIVIAPQLYTFSLIMPYIPSQAKEISKAATVINWLPSNLQRVLQKRVNGVVKADIQKLAVSGHSRGGKSAFALALGMSETKILTKISALIGVDPVAGRNNHLRTMPHVLSDVPNSFNLSIPVTVIGTGYGSAGLFPCAPSNVSYQQFFTECKDGSQFVIAKYGHMQMLNDDLNFLDKIVSSCCYSGRGPKTTMRRTLGGIMVAFLEAYFREEKEQYFALLDNPSLAPTSLIVEKKGDLGFAPITIY